LQGYAQFSGWKEKALQAGAALGAKKTGLDQVLKKPESITTSFEDVDQTGSKLPDLLVVKNAQPLYLLPKATEGGYVLCDGFYEMSAKSYCLKAGTFAPSQGDGYMYAPTLGPKQEIVTTILKNGEKHPEIKQHNIQELLWAIIARARFADFSGQLKLTAVALLSTAELTHLEGGMLGVLPASIMNQAKSKLPEAVQNVFEAENNIRQMVANGNYTYAEICHHCRYGTCTHGYSKWDLDFTPRWILHSVFSLWLCNNQSTTLCSQNTIGYWKTNCL
jgi:hypothetical protein